MINKTSSANKSCCSGNSSCCGEEQSIQTVQTEGREITIDFLYLDLNVCIPCRGTENSLEDGISEVKAVLEAMNVKVVLNKINVTSEELAIKYKFQSSPTIRINGRDIQLEITESLCESCGDLCGGDVDCRVWIYQGKEYNSPPKAMIIDAILREVYSARGEETDNIDAAFKLPDNLKNFFTAKANKDAKQELSSIVETTDVC